ncbi:6-phosphogluconolactonase/glucosamine-6-phosphate isomerase/deaminase [Sphaerochaeta pleomorpha str. Grapes]|uniref:6-phosphogluconolactonase/glucosamine-6-phosphate isomerase/deaminase n=1 Tax=Sphaerochaeta pleomorpha (strain ATCC BAA-1885 / DSM 22778 / Grapes) TaxID=158190 RepID=G8QTK1_SPHPG|nr:6-phosphogluconolactonase [Sphaerochaeta pleomorpha]AEV30242.1 6-phosphogluconolactonase/glucosamine-6-phosphate isomerase/deaminase [Sphaerochaeta pleomorpha str. Grapes]
METLYLERLEDLSLLVHDDLIEYALISDGLLHVGIPGGRSAKPLVQGILSCPPEILSRLCIYLVDERLSGETNFSTLLDVGLKEAFASGLLKPEQLVVPQREKPLMGNDGKLSLLYLGVGEDGHIASLFPSSYPLLDEQGKEGIALVDNSPKPPAQRITVTYRGFRTWAKQAKIRLLFLGESKREALLRFLLGKEGASSLPCRFFVLEGFTVTVVTDLKGIPK